VCLLAWSAGAACCDGLHTVTCFARQSAGAYAAVDVPPINVPLGSRDSRSFSYPWQEVRQCGHCVAAWIQRPADA
jgi:hypothetical protein